MVGVGDDTRALPILVVEDNDEDYVFMVRAFKQVGVENPIDRCTDDDALDYLYRRGAYACRAGAPRPAIILLDLNMPGTDGLGVLSEVRNDADLRGIPVVILTTSSSQTDVEEIYKAGANSYMQKPMGVSGFVDALSRFKEYWLKTTILP